MTLPLDDRSMKLLLNIQADVQYRNDFKSLNSTFLVEPDDKPAPQEKDGKEKKVLNLHLDLAGVSRRPGLGFVFACGSDDADVVIPPGLKVDGICFKIKFDDMYNLILHNMLGESLRMSYYCSRNRTDSPTFTVHESIIGLVLHLS